MTPRDVFVTGGTGFVGRALIQELLARGHRVHALIRSGSVRRLPRGAKPIVGDALLARTYAAHVAPADTLVQLVGTPHPGPTKALDFDRVDRASGLAAVDAALAAGVRHLVYVSVAQPAPVMKAYVAARAAVEARIGEAHAASALGATILRPWYVLGPGRRWAHALRPLYAVGRLLPPTRDGAARLGLVTRAEMVGALVWAIENPTTEVRVMDVPRIRDAARAVTIAARLGEGAHATRATLRGFAQRLSGGTRWR